MSEGKKAKVHQTKEEKLRIINEVRKSGLSVTCTKYGIYPASYYQWVAKLKEMG
nr:transposase [Bacteroidia bacterium]